MARHSISSLQKRHIRMNNEAELAKQSSKITFDTNTTSSSVSVCQRHSHAYRPVELVDPSGIRWRETSEDRCSMRSIACDDAVCIKDGARAWARSKARSKNFHDGVRRSPVRCEFGFNVYYRTLRETKIKRLDRSGACVHTCRSSNTSRGSNRGQQQQGRQHRRGSSSQQQGQQQSACDNRRRSDG